MNMVEAGPVGGEDALLTWLEEYARRLDTGALSTPFLNAIF